MGRDHTGQRPNVQRLRSVKLTETMPRAERRSAADRARTVCAKAPRRTAGVGSMQFNVFIFYYSLQIFFCRFQGRHEWINREGL